MLYFCRQKENLIKDVFDALAQQNSLVSVCLRKTELEENNRIDSFPCRVILQLCLIEAFIRVTPAWIRSARLIDEIGMMNG